MLSCYYVKRAVTQVICMWRKNRSRSEITLEERCFIKYLILMEKITMEIEKRVQDLAWIMSAF